MVISDAFQDPSTWNGYMPPSDFPGVILDTHIYQIFSPEEVARSEDDRISVACAKRDDMTAAGIWTIVGEWTPARTDCAKYLNGRGVGARYDGSYPGSSYVGSCAGVTGSASTFNDGYKRFLRRFWEAQVQAYEASAGWVMWTWKAEEADDWSYQAGLQGGWIPQNPTDYKYPNICG